MTKQLGPNGALSDQHKKTSAEVLFAIKAGCNRSTSPDEYNFRSHYIDLDLRSDVGTVAAVIAACSA